MAAEKPTFKVLRRGPGFEIRDYAACLVVETVAAGSREEAGNKGFRRLAAYLAGKNKGPRSNPRTSTAQEKGGQKLAMTVPVQTAQPDTGTTLRWTIQFHLPAAVTLDTAPEPLDPQVAVRELPPCQMVVRRYSGTWSEGRFHSNLLVLQHIMAEQSLRPVGEPHWARYDPPFMPWLLRTNEILIESAPAARLGTQSI